MKRQILFAHSAGSQGGPGEGSYDFVNWLKKSLDGDFEIHYPKIHDPDSPTAKAFDMMLENEFAKLEDGCVLIGHSLGGSMLLKFLSERNIDLKIRGLFLVAAPYWGLEDWDYEEFKLKDDFFLHLNNVPEIHLFHCINDPVVSFHHTEVYAKKLRNAVAHAVPGDDHAFGDGLPELVECIKKVP